MGEIERGSAGMLLELAGGRLVARRTDGGEVLFDAFVTEGTWDSIWAAMRGGEADLLVGVFVRGKLARMEEGEDAVFADAEDARRWANSKYRRYRLGSVVFGSFGWQEVK